MSKVLVAYFSASGVTAKVAAELAKAEGADLYEIKPAVPYTAADLDYMVKDSRANLEMADKSCRPAIDGKIADISRYQAVFVGFPVWWGREPSIIDTFLESYDFTGKKVIPFCTSGGSGVSGAAANMRAVLGGKVSVDDGKRVGGQISEEELKVWTAGLEL